ncbi:MULTISPECIES: dihydroxyacetone kinase phosphoryl donor subunit DhaM [Clostridium]|jgi:PTS hybrid protein|uniref:phosphoenolpyruvate--glycerone phosphotransferase n=2 Tax=Clostridium TaxID=1485 RepID=A0A151ANK5_9CLOT|nr:MULTISPECIES: dihydroxyacetone kinase phosphoryl donor subunit DhaM [Clostridium]KYH29212.1 PTS-dependent dihydroxyacetone kinase, phosphotransferase subunit DhaM [Clostridium colicanis DSM 13634]MBE6042908.1 PTS-dependent dihydroxyacetone kinase phosphotransferase subunit DhaM [Clostridium thermopalmarium]PRR71073.1 PTS-dependent dihydroxyacetone kinase, phosphotransferase subunit DhaM [Clostridium thermopalmarium DSM 5974]PVZ23588.1 dihydroxyacetone kinase phosphotransfer subunit [Clostrid
MVGLVIVSHSEKVAQGVKELASQMASGLPIAAAGGTSDGRLGTDMGKILNAINEVYSQDGVLIIFDLGSAYMNAEMALEFLEEDMRNNVEIIDTAIVEGAITAAVESSIGKTMSEIKEAVKNMSLGKMP